MTTEELARLVLAHDPAAYDRSEEAAKKMIRSLGHGKALDFLIALAEMSPDNKMLLEIILSAACDRLWANHQDRMFDKARQLARQVLKEAEAKEHAR